MHVKPKIRVEMENLKPQSSTKVSLSETRCRRTSRIHTYATVSSSLFFLLSLLCFYFLLVQSDKYKPVPDQFKMLTLKIPRFELVWWNEINTKLAR